MSNPSSANADAGQKPSPIASAETSYGIEKLVSNLRAIVLKIVVLGVDTVALPCIVMDAATQGTAEMNSSTIPAFRKLKGTAGGERWAAGSVEYGWSYSGIGSAFCSNRSASAHAYAAVWSGDKRSEIFSERVSAATYADAKASVRAQGALEAAREAAIRAAIQ